MALLFIFTVYTLFGASNGQVDPATPQISGRTILWSDEFNGGIDRGRWAFDIWAPGNVNNELQSYTDSSANAYTENGNLVIRAIQNGNSYSSARLHSTNRWTYGYAEVRAQIPTAQGFWPAIWQLPAVVNWPQCGEIDIMEHVSCDMNIVVSTVHTGAYNHVLGTQKTSQTGKQVNQFHTYKVDWTPNQIRFSVDNDAPHFIFNNDNTGNDDTWPFNKAFDVILNIAVGGDWGGYCLNGARPNFPNDGVTNVMRVDYVRVYSTTSDGGSTCNGPYNGFPECEDRIQWMQQNWNKDDATRNYYLNQGLVDGSRCNVQKYLAVREGFCPDTSAGTINPVGGACNSGGSVWNAIADGYSCGDRITWLTQNGTPDWQAAKNIVAAEFPNICGACAARRRLRATTAK